MLQVMEHLQEVLLSAPQGLTDMQRESEEEAVQRHQRMLACCLAALTGLCSMLLPAPSTQARPQQDLQQDEVKPGQAATNGTSGGEALCPALAGLEAGLVCWPGLLARGARPRCCAAVRRANEVAVSPGSVATAQSGSKVLCLSAGCPPAAGS